MYARRSWLTLRWPFRLSWNIVKRTAGLRCFAEQPLLDRVQEGELALSRRNVANGLLQREHALRALERVEAKAPVDHFQHVVGVRAGPDFLGRNEMILRDARVGGLRRKSRKAGKHAGADAVDVGPWPQPVRVAILLRRGKPGCVHRCQLGTGRGQRLPRGAEIEEH